MRIVALDVAVEHFDLSLENRRATANEACTQAAARMRETVAAGTRTPDLGGHAGTTEFTDSLIALLERKLDAGPPREGSS